MIIQTENCKDCKFFNRQSETEDYGVCKRMPPQLVLHPKINDYVSAHPTVSLDNNCGEYVPQFKLVN